MNMNGIRVLLLSIITIAFAVSAEACLSCYADGFPPSGGGTCGWSSSGYCSGDCCWSDVGFPCRIPDFWYPCYSGTQPAPLMQKREAPRMPQAYFSSRQPLEHVRVRFLARSRKCAANEAV